MQALHECARAPGTAWAISSVNPSISEHLQGILRRDGHARARWFRSAADVAVENDLEEPARTGADRALAVLAAMEHLNHGQAGIVVCCGTAITVERISRRKRWEGGAIGPGLSISARGLKQFTAQLPRIEIEGPPPAWGRSTVPASQAGVFWGTVGAVKELIARQRANGLENAKTIWTGGDAAALAAWIEPGNPLIVPDLVLDGLVIAAFGGSQTP
jgi:type III pantothenate kinase